MYVCICRGITDTQIRDEVHNGACTLREVRERLGVAGQCGKCGMHARGIIKESIQEIVQEDQGMWEPAA